MKINLVGGKEISSVEEENRTEKKRKREKNKEREKKGKEEEEKGRRTGCSSSIFRRSGDQGVGIVHTPRARGFLLFRLFHA